MIAPAAEQTATTPAMATGLDSRAVEIRKWIAVAGYTEFTGELSVNYIARGLNVRMVAAELAPTINAKQ